MTLHTIPGPTIIPARDFVSITTALAVTYLLFKLVSNLNVAFFGPLSHFPGPTSRALSVLPLVGDNWSGQDNVRIPALHRKYGNVVRVGPNMLSFVGDAQIIKDIYGFRKHGQAEVKKNPRFYSVNINRVPGLIQADYAVHSRQRKIVSHAFSDRALKEQEPMLKCWAQMLKDKLTEQAQRGTKSDLVLMYNCTTFDVMGDLTFAEPLNMLEGGEYTPWVKTIFDSIKILTTIRAIRQLGTLAKMALDELVFRIPAIRMKQLDHWKYTTDRVDRRLAKTPDRPDLFTRILEKSKSQADGLSLQELYSISSLFMLAGTETTATALSGTTFHLLKNPSALARLQKELRENFTSMDDLHLESLARLPILDATLREGLRMYPPVPIGLPRLSPPGGMMVGDTFVPEGTSISVHHLSTYRQDCNFKHSEQFRPERWQGDPEFKDDKLDAVEPFSVGPRNCLGKNLAWHEMRLLLSTVLLHFDLELMPESSDWANQRVWTLWEKMPLMCKLTPTT